MLKNRIKSAFTLTEVAISLGALTVVLALMIPAILDSINASSEASARAHITKMTSSVMSAMNQYKMTRDLEQATAESVFDELDYVRKFTTGSFSVDAAPGNPTGVTETTYTLGGGTVAYQMKDGGALVIKPQSFSTDGTFTACGPTQRRALLGHYDPDGQASGTNDSVHFLLYETGDVRTLENALANTCTAFTSTQGAVANADPDFL